VQPITKTLVTVATLLASGTAVAYVGPGAGISVLGALWGLIVGIVMAVGVILFWPIRIMLRKRKAAKAAKAASETNDSNQNNESTEDTEQNSSSQAS
jgi:hypothetical protein